MVREIEESGSALVETTAAVIYTDRPSTGGEGCFFLIIFGVYADRGRMCRRGRVFECRRPERPSLRRQHHGLREHARVVRVPLQCRVRAAQPVRVRRCRRVRPGGVAVPFARQVHQHARWF